MEFEDPLSKNSIIGIYENHLLTYVLLEHDLEAWDTATQIVSKGVALMDVLDSHKDPSGLDNSTEQGAGGT